MDDTPEPDPVVRLAAARAALLRLRESEAGARVVLPSDVAAHVRGEAGEDAARVEAALGQDLALRRVYLGLLRTRSVATGGRQVAASVGDRDRLVLDGALVRWGPSPVPGRYLVLLELTGSSPGPDRSVPILHLVRDDECRHLRFPELVDGVSQAILAAEDPRLSMLKESDARAESVAYHLVIA